jgi:hypothetical protein
MSLPIFLVVCHNQWHTALTRWQIRGIGTVLAERKAERLKVSPAYYI